MNFEEHAAKPLLAEAGIAIPKSELAASPAAAADAAGRIGPVMVKAQVPTGKRGKAGGVRPADSAAQAREAAAAILGMEITGHKVDQVLIEERAEIAREFYAAVLTDTVARCPLVIFSTEGGMDIEEVAARDPQAIRRHLVDITEGFTPAMARDLLAGLELDPVGEAVADTLVALYGLYLARDAELLEINPLVATGDGRVIALDCKFTLDDSALSRQPDLAGQGAEDPMTELEAQGAAAGLRYIELDGDVGILANGAGLTMTTMDAVSHYGGQPANFLEIGGEAYTKAVPALQIVLGNSKVKSLVVNFCGAFARCDVMTAGVVEAWETLRPGIPVFFSIHGTGEAEAVALLKERLDMEPYDVMDDAVKAAIAAAR